ncbi:rhamnulokinase [mine drainage metagenome]|uniref:Rhamnulokinase n=1 Tax=mine drainage metagenome TaxID=410659 RepID=A0A1J5SWK3_9ZZZZ
MNKISVIAIFDVGKTNKKLLLFDKEYKLVFEEARTFEEIKDEDGFPCEDINAVTVWIKNSIKYLLNNERFSISAINFSAYGASFVYLDEKLNTILPLYNYLKPLSNKLKEKFYKDYGGESVFAKQTASPVLGNLNSGMQLYRLKHEKTETFSKIKHALHLPQYLSFILTGKLFSDITSIGCHTNLWNFQKNKYHDWVRNERIDTILPPIKSNEEITGYYNKTIPIGLGIHDSSAALIPYLSSFTEPFVLISTGTWSISLNPFNHSPLTDDELRQDCLCYLSYKADPVKASRLFAGHEHEQQIKRLSEHFNKQSEYFETVQFDSKLLNDINFITNDVVRKQSSFVSRDLNIFYTYEEAYHQLMADIVYQQVCSTNLILKGTEVQQIFVDGGFSKNSVYMNLLAREFPKMKIFAASVPQASAVGAALVIHKYWNNNPVPSDLINLKNYSIIKK